MVISEKLMAELRCVTGWSIDKINIETSKLKCDYNVAKDVFLASGRFPNEPEQIVINNFGFEVWFSMYQQGLIKK